LRPGPGAPTESRPARAWPSRPCPAESSRLPVAFCPSAPSCLLLSCGLCPGPRPSCGLSPVSVRPAASALAHSVLLTRPGSFRSAASVLAPSVLRPLPCLSPSCGLSPVSIRPAASILAHFVLRPLPCLCPSCGLFPGSFRPAAFFLAHCVLRTRPGSFRPADPSWLILSCGPVLAHSVLRPPSWPSLSDGLSPVSIRPAASVLAHFVLRPLPSLSVLRPRPVSGRPAKGVPCPHPCEAGRIRAKKRNLAPWRNPGQALPFLPAPTCRPGREGVWCASEQAEVSKG
jgi:hypothetical protein